MFLYAIVCGGRDYCDKVKVKSYLDFINGIASSMRLELVVVHGAATGADTLAGDWALSRFTPTIEFPVSSADWNSKGRAAGPLRNKHMLDSMLQRKQEQDYLVVVAFPGGKGTKNMMNLAEKEGVIVLQVD